MTVKAKLVAFLGAEKPLDSVTPRDADRYRAELLRQGLAETTVARQVKYARQFFKAARRARIIDENPFADVTYLPGSRRTRACSVTSTARPSNG